MKKIITIMILAIIAGLYATAAFAGPVGNPIAAQYNATAASDLIPTVKYNALYGFTVTSGASAGYVLVFDATSLPADGTVTPQNCIKVAATSTVSESFNPPEQFATGIVVAFSTTGCFTKTASSTAFFNVQAQ